MTQCSFFRNWWHARQRRQDLRWMVILIEACPEMSLARQIWERATELPLFEHWQCECGQEFSQLIRRVYFSVDAQHERVAHDV